MSSAILSEIEIRTSHMEAARPYIHWHTVGPRQEQVFLAAQCISPQGEKTVLLSMQYVVESAASAATPIAITNVLILGC